MSINNSTSSLSKLLVIVILGMEEMELILIVVFQIKCMSFDGNDDFIDVGDNNSILIL